MESGLDITVKELRKFGLVMTAPLVLAGCYLLWKDRSAAPFVLGAAGTCFLTALIRPGLLSPFQRVWMKLAHALSIVTTTVILVVTYYLVMTPLGIFLRLIGKDLLQLKYQHKCSTYWVPVDGDGPHSRPDKPY